MADGTAFLDIARLFVTLESTTKRNEKKKIIIHFFQKLAKEDIRPAISFLAGRVFPEADNRVLDVGGRIISDVSREHRQSILVPNPLTISTVRNTFNEIINFSHLRAFTYQTIEVTEGSLVFLFPRR